MVSMMSVQMVVPVRVPNELVGVMVDMPVDSERDGAHSTENEGRPACRSGLLAEGEKAPDKREGRT